MLSCQRCKQSTNGPQAFLLTCQTCNRTWHHRCHMPPVEDAELFQRLRSTNDQDMANSIYAWMCRRCRKGTPGMIPSVMSGGFRGGPTVSSAALEDEKSLVSRDNPAVKDTPSTSAASTDPPKAKLGPSTVVDALNDGKLNRTSDRTESADGAPAKITIIDKREIMAARKLPCVQTQLNSTKLSRDVDVEMAGEITPQERRPLQSLSELPTSSGARKVTAVDTRDISKASSRQIPGARKTVSTGTIQDFSMPSSRHISDARKAAASLTHSEADVEMTDDVRTTALTESTPGPTLQILQTSSSESLLIELESAQKVQPDARAASPFSTQEQDVRPANEVAIQPQGNQDVHVDDDPEDLYGPPVERRIIRILPSLAEELREQHRQAAIQKEKKPKRAYLAPDWILARYANDPLWKKVPTANARRRPRKAQAKKLGESGLDVNELVGYFTAANWVRGHIVCAYRS